MCATWLFQLCVWVLFDERAGGWTKWNIECLFWHSQKAFDVAFLFFWNFKTISMYLFICIVFIRKKKVRTTGELFENIDQAFSRGDYSLLLLR